LRRAAEHYFLRRWYGSVRPGIGWRLLTAVHARAASRRLGRPVARPECPVIVVGNLTVGGGGKTPVTVALAGALRERGFRPAIISRGYRADRRTGPLEVTGDADPARVGDEPVLLARRAACPVWVCRDRAGALAAARAAGADVVISDDGLQHRRLPRSFEICVIDGARGFGNGLLLPAGPMRQPLERLASVDLVLRKQVAGSVEADGLPGTPFELAPGPLQPVGAGGAGDGGPPSQGDAVDAVCGIAHPESFFGSLEYLGYRVRRHAFPDHHRFTVTDLANLQGPLVVTEKDAVKLERLVAPGAAWLLPVEARLPAAVTCPVIKHVREFDGDD